ncbi:MAG: potassium channel family protein [Candidatus Altiarchaeota archaeon]|nr:potassium channel family protein [Candidatus Altiarchaeota archaeon]
MRTKTKNLFYAVILIFLVVVVGTIGYTQLEGLNLVDALYFTIVTVSSVGYGDIKPSTPESKIFTIFLILTGLILLFYLVSALVSSLVEVSLLDILRFRRIRERLRKMKNHVILCGYGDVGTLIAEGLGTKGVVVIDKDEEKFNEIIRKEFVGVHGDSTNPQTLEAAGIKDAKSIVIALDSDPDAVYTILTAKELNPDIEIYVRANEKGSSSKMKRAGANYVICLPAVGSTELLKAMDLKEGKKVC